MLTHLRPAIVATLLLTLITGVIYPAAVTLAARLLFPGPADGSLIMSGNRVVGSELIGQSFTTPRYFWGRPSATGPLPYNAAASGGSNLGPSNPALLSLIRARVEALHQADPGNSTAIPIDLVTASASGLDPEISPAAAAYQISRVARARGLTMTAVEGAVLAATRGRFAGLLGEPGVNVLKLNLALDRLTATR